MVLFTLNHRQSNHNSPGFIVILSNNCAGCYTQLPGEKQQSSILSAENVWPATNPANFLQSPAWSPTEAVGISGIYATLSLSQLLIWTFNIKIFTCRQIIHPNSLSSAICHNWSFEMWRSSQPPNRRIQHHNKNNKNGTLWAEVAEENLTVQTLGFEPMAVIAGNNGRRMAGNATGFPIRIFEDFFDGQGFSLELSPNSALTL